MKCKLCDFVSLAEDKEMASMNLEAHYFYVHRKGSKEAEKLVAEDKKNFVIKNTNEGRVAWFD